MLESTWLDSLQRIVSSSTLILVSSIVLYSLTYVFYNLFLHPLRSYPGPLLWRMSRLPWDYNMSQGKLNHRILELHKRYGDVVRIAPDELSFNQGQAFKDIFAHVPGREEFGKDPYTVLPAMNGVSGILGANKENHARFRRLLAHAFSEKGLRDQESHIASFVDLLIDCLGEVAKTSEATDMVTWYTRTAFDVIGDLAWGESFDSLEERKTHEWIPAISGSVKFIMLFNIVRRKGLEWIAPHLLDKKTIELRAKNFKFVSAKVQRRIEHGADRGDFWDRVMIKSANDNDKGEGMTEREMIANASILVLGGSETSATTLSGATYLLLTNPKMLEKVVNEVRTTFTSPEEITLFSVARLSYQFAVLEETLRLYPPVPSMSSRVVPKGGGTVCGKYVPEGMIVNAHAYSAHRSERSFHRADEFLPERWLDDATAEFAKDDKFACQPFSMGTRNCIGRNLAYAEMRLILAKLLWHFDLVLDAERTGDWMDQKTWGIWHKPPLWVKLSVAEH